MSNDSIRWLLDTKLIRSNLLPPQKRKSYSMNVSIFYVLWSLLSIAFIIGIVIIIRNIIKMRRNEISTIKYLQTREADNLRNKTKLKVNQLAPSVSLVEGER
jgi:hypothetical protein